MIINNVCSKHGFVRYTDKPIEPYIIDMSVVKDSNSLTLFKGENGSLITTDTKLSSGINNHENALSSFEGDAKEYKGFDSLTFENLAESLSRYAQMDCISMQKKIFKDYGIRYYTHTINKEGIEMFIEDCKTKEKQKCIKNIQTNIFNLERNLSV